jgi:hypothetical protein
MALGWDSALGPRLLAVFAVVCFAIHLAVGLTRFTQQKNRWKKATQSANTLISLLFLAAPVIRLCIRVFTRSRHTAR